MKAISKQGRHLSGNRFAAAPLRHMLKTMGAKIFPGNSGRLRGDFTGGSPLQKNLVRVARRSGLAKKREPESANDATINQLQEYLAEAGAILPAQQEAFDEGALRVEPALPGGLDFAGILPIEHPLVMAYISSCQQDNRMIYISPQIANLGFTQEAWLGEADLRLQWVHEEDRERLAQAIQHSCKTGERFSCYYRIYDGCGKIRWLHDEANVGFDKTGMPLFIRGAILDITDKKEMEAELNEHRYCLEQRVELRTGQLLKRIALLESCNATLCNKLALANKGITPLIQQPAASAMQQGQATQSISAAETSQTAQTTGGAHTNDGIEQPDDISVRAQKMIELTRENWIVHGCYRPPRIKRCAAPATQTASSALPDNCIEQLDGISDWARKMIGWRVTAAGSIA